MADNLTAVNDKAKLRYHTWCRIANLEGIRKYSQEREEFLRDNDRKLAELREAFEKSTAASVELAVRSGLAFPDLSILK